MEQLPQDRIEMPSVYQPVTDALVAELKDIVGPANLIFGEPERMQDYAHDEAVGAHDETVGAHDETVGAHDETVGAHDEVAGAEYAHLPEVVVKPKSADEVSRIMRLANRERIPVTPRGAGSGLSGGAVPVFGGILLSVERMNRIVEIDRENMVVVVEPGVVTNDINKAIQDMGLFYAGYPMSVEMCFIGGNVAENAGGGRAIKYGVTSRYVLGLQVVLPTGDIIRLGGKRVKDVTGYDLIHLLVGSEGTLGIFTEVTLRLMPLPVARVVVLVPFPDVTSAIRAVPRVMTQGHVIPSSVEFMDRLSVETTYAYLKETPPHPNIGAMLLLEVDAFSRAQAEAEYTAIVELCLEAGALDAYVGDSPAKEKKMWRPRQVMSEALTALARVQNSEDIVVPMAQIPEWVEELQALSQKYSVLMPCFGHAGDGNLHIRIMKNEQMSLEEWKEMLPHLLEEMYTRAAALGGTISGEHGIGSKRARYLPLVMDPATLALHKRIKQAFDPLNILNPGKILL